MAENEIPYSGADHLSTVMFYRVTIVPAQMETGFQQHPGPAQVMIFNEGSLWDMKERALRFFTTQMAQKFATTSDAGGEMKLSTPILAKLSFIKSTGDGSEEEFTLIGGTNEEMLDARLEEEIAFAIHRSSKLY
jgi:hypothetical protein